MKKKATFDAIVNANNAITIPEATRKKYDIKAGALVTVEMTVEEDKEYGNREPAHQSSSIIYGICQ